MTGRLSADGRYRAALPAEKWNTVCGTSSTESCAGSSKRPGPAWRRRLSEAHTRAKYHASSGETSPAVGSGRCRADAGQTTSPEAPGSSMTFRNGAGRLWNRSSKTSGRA